MTSRFTVSDARINADGPAHLTGVRFVRCTLVWETDIRGVVMFGGCEFRECLFLINGMEVTWDEFCALTKPKG